MPRPKKAMPSYRYHISGQAIVTLGGKDFYLGTHNSPESHAKYLSLVAEYQRNGLRAPQADAQQGERCLTVGGLIADFRTNGLSRITPSEHHRATFRNLATLLVDEYGDCPAQEFGPRKLDELRSLFIASGNCRRHANEQTSKIRRIFRWAVSRELIGPEQLVALDSLKNLQEGEAKENPPREAVALETVKATLPLVDRVVADMVRLQLATGCRPSELFSLVPAELKRIGEDWIIKKRTHKTKKLGKEKRVPIVGEAQVILAPYLLRGEEDPCFTNRRGTPWNKDTYRRHITRCCERNGIEHWTPYCQLAPKQYQ